MVQNTNPDSIPLDVLMEMDGDVPRWKTVRIVNDGRHWGLDLKPLHIEPTD